MTNKLAVLLLLILFSCTHRLNKNGAPEIRVLTYNIHHANPPSKPDFIDLQAVANVIKNSKPDIVALQEIDVHTTRSGRQINQAEELGRLTGMKAYFAKAIDYGGGEYGVAVLSRYPMKDLRNTALPTDESTKGEHRTLGRATIEMPGRKNFVFAFTHLDAQSSPVNRILQMQKISELLEEEPLPVIIAGDLNAVAGSAEINILDTRFARTCVRDCAFTIPQKNPRKTIDFIAFRPLADFKVISHEVIAEEYASDHRPVFAVLK